MVKAKIGDEIVNMPLRLRVRFDYRGVSKPKGLFFGSKNIDQVAEETRDNKAALLRNVPVQGIHIEDIDTSSEVYTVFDEALGAPVAYAPIQVTIQAEVIEDVVRFIMQEEFRKVELLEPDQVVLGKHDIERLLFKMNEELRAFQIALERRANLR